MNRRSQSASKSDSPQQDSTEKGVALSRSQPSRDSGSPARQEPNPSRQDLEAEIALYRHALERAREEFQAFAYSVSHDLRAPLRAIEGFSKILEEDYARELGPEPQRYLKHVVTNAQQLGSQIDDLLRYYRTIKNAPTKIGVDADSICRDALIAADARLSRTASIVQHELPSVLADPIQLREIFLQLVANALKFTSKTPQPKIEIGSKSEPGAKTFFVRDNGVGFDMRNSERLFQVFQKFHNAADYPGNGMGLAIVKRLVEGHGGCVSADSRPGKGSVFCFSLPDGVERVKTAPSCSVPLAAS